MKVYNRILVVDNEADFAESLRMTLAARAHQVVTAKNRAQAEEIVSKEHFDALVLGTITPRGDAFARNATGCPGSPRWWSAASAAVG